MLVFVTGCAAIAMSKDDVKANNAEAQSVMAEYCQLPECDQPPTVLKRYPPQYPHLLGVNRIEGDATFEFTINEEGKTEDLELVEATHSEFADATRRVLSKWRFTPAKLNGEPIALEVEQTIQYRLSN